MADNFLELVKEYNIPRWSTGFWGLRFAEASAGLILNLIMEGAAQAIQSGWSYPFDPSTDEIDISALAIGRMANDAGLISYPRELPHADTLPRIQNKIAFWSGPIEAGLAAEISAATGREVLIFTDRELQIPIDGIDYWSRFWVDVKGASVTGPSPVVGGFNVGATTLGPQGLDLETVNAVRAAIERFKPAQWVCWDILFRDALEITYPVMVHPSIRPATAIVNPIPVSFLDNDRLTFFNAPPAGVSPWNCQVEPTVQLTAPSAGETPALDGNDLIFDGIDDTMLTSLHARLHWAQTMYLGVRIRRIDGTGVIISYTGFSVNVTETEVQVTVFPTSPDTVTVTRRFTGDLSGTYPFHKALEVFIDRGEPDQTKALQVAIEGELLPLAAPITDPIPPTSTGGAVAGLTLLAHPEMSVGSMIFYPEPGPNFLGTYSHLRSRDYLGV